MQLVFSKMSGAGNDFIFLGPDYSAWIESAGLLARRLCQRKTSIGGDGLVIVEKRDRTVMHYYNSDGTRAAFCGNGARCLVLYCIEKGIEPNPFEFQSDWGRHTGKLAGGSPSVSVPMPEIIREVSLELEKAGFDGILVRSGVPHVIIRVDDVEGLDVRSLGRTIRFHHTFGEEGANVDFVQVAGRSRLKVRTYERGVEDETLACGSGCLAAGYLLWKQGIVPLRISVEVASGETLMVEIDEADQRVFLGGPAEIVYEGTIEVKELGNV